MGINYVDAHKVKAGMKLFLTCLPHGSGLQHMRKYEVVEVHDPDWLQPFVTIKEPTGKQSTWLLSRFDFPEPIEDPKVGQKVRFIGRGEIDFLRGRVYEVTGILDGGVIQVTNDRGTTTFISQSNFIPYS